MRAIKVLERLNRRGDEQLSLCCNWAKARLPAGCAIPIIQTGLFRPSFLAVFGGLEAVQVPWRAAGGPGGAFRDIYPRTAFAFRRAHFWAFWVLAVLGDGVAFPWGPRAFASWLEVLEVLEGLA